MHLLKTAAAILLAVWPLAGQAQPLPAEIPGLTVNLSHSGYWPGERPIPSPATRYVGGDLGGKRGDTFIWWSMFHPSAVWSSEMLTRLPPGLVFGLKHSINQRNQLILTFGQYDVVNGPRSFPGFLRTGRGDIGAPEGEGLMWYESAGRGTVDWTLIDRLPKFTIMGLRHSINYHEAANFDLQIFWQGKYACTYQGNTVGCDCVNTQVAPPPGWSRVGRYDAGAPAGEGYCWYEKRY